MKQSAAKSSTATAPKSSGGVAQHQPFFGGREGAAPVSDVENQFFAPAAALGIQTKLTIGAPDDPLEREADAVADQVVQRLAENSSAAVEPPAAAAQNLEAKPIQRLPISTIQRKCDHCEQEEKMGKGEEEEQLVQEKIQRKPIFESAGDPPPDDDAPNLQRKISDGGSGDWGVLQMKCADCAAEEQESVLQKKDAGGGGEATASADISSRLSASKGGGSPLPADLSASMGGAMGADFSGVRVHTDSAAAGLSGYLGARAFTHGRDIYFNDRQFSPNSSAGKRLLAHELTHTVQQGAVLRRMPQVLQASTPDLQLFSLNPMEWLKDGLNSIAETVIPGYSLLNVILGKNMITDEPVERSGINLIQGFMEITPVIGSLLFKELEETKTLQEAGAWTEAQVKKLKINFDDVARRLKLMWDAMDATAGLDYNITVFKMYMGPVLGKLLAFSGLMFQKMRELRLEGALLMFGATELLNTLKASPEAFKRVANDPTVILSNFMEALKLGFNNFKDNFATHFQNALFGWLLGKAASMGIQMPKEFSMAGVFHLVAQIAGLTYEQIKKAVIQRLGERYGDKAEKVFNAIEEGVEVVKRVFAEGPIALWEMLKEKLANLKDMVLSQITELVTAEIIKSAVLKLVSMLNPAGALVQLVMTLYKVIKFFVDNWETIKEVANGIISSITKVALGKLGDAASFVESVLAKGVQLIISFLARIFGLDGIADKVKELIKKFTGFIAKGRDYVIDWLIEQGAKFFAAITGGGEDDESKKEHQNNPEMAAVEQAIQNQGKEKGEDGEVTRSDADLIAQNVKTDNADSVGSITLIDGGRTWRFEYIQKTTVEVPKSQDYLIYSALVGLAAELSIVSKNESETNLNLQGVQSKLNTLKSKYLVAKNSPPHTFKVGNRSFFVENSSGYIFPSDRVKDDYQYTSRGMSFAKIRNILVLLSSNELALNSVDKDELNMFLSSMIVEPSRNAVAGVTNLVLLDDLTISEKNAFDTMPMTGGGTVYKTTDDENEEKALNPEKDQDPELKPIFDLIGKGQNKKVTDREIQIIKNHPEIGNSLSEIFENYQGQSAVMKIRVLIKSKLFPGDQS